MIIKLLNTIFVVFILAISFVIIVSALGWVRLLVVKTGSMLPTLGVNSLVIVIPEKSPLNKFQAGQPKYSVGQIVSFKAVFAKELVTHRIVGIQKSNGGFVYQTKGDANNIKDVGVTTESNIYGKEMFAAPFVGNVVGFLGTFWGILLLVIIPASIVILHEVLVIQAEMKGKSLSLKKQHFSAGLIVLSLLVFSTPVFGFFTSNVFLPNSLSTKESFTADHIIINEVYYQVDSSHGADSAKDRNKVCSASRNNNANVNNSVSVDSNTGGNSASGNTGGNVVLNTGSSSANVNIQNNVNQSSASCNNNDEWLELYNPTEIDISLKNWVIQDNSTKSVKITTNKIIKTHGFALLSKSASTWSFWNEGAGAVKVELGKIIGDGLDNTGDRLTIRNPDGVVVDQISYGSDHTILNPSIGLVARGHSLARSNNGFDSDLASDFIDRTLPSPGN